MQRTVNDIFDNDTALTRKANDILNGFAHDDYIHLRHEVRSRNRKGDSRYLCDICGTRLELTCTKNELDEHTFFFRHQKDPGLDKCPIKSNCNLTKEQILRNQYAFKKESKPHIEMKEKLGAIIRSYIDPEVIVDSKFIKDKFGDSERRKPDVLFKNKLRDIVLEIQLNNTFLSVIEEREAFYAKNQISLVWIFRYFNPDEFQSISTKDIYVPNYNNAFVFDEKAEQESHNRKTLCLNVYYKNYEIEEDAIKEEWLNQIIEVDQLEFSSDTHRPFFFNSPELKRLINEELKRKRELKLEERQQKDFEKKITSFKDYLKRFKENDLVQNENWPYFLSKFSEREKSMLNDLIKLSDYQNNGRDIIQTLIDKKRHNNLIRFLLKTKEVNLYLNTGNGETVLMTILQSEEFFKDEILKFLFLRGYGLTELDTEFIKDKHDRHEALKTLKKYSYYEKALTEGNIDTINKYCNEFFLIECVKQDEIELLGDGVQGKVWLANLAANQYMRHWKYFNLAFTHFGFYDKVFKINKNGSFKNRVEELRTLYQERDFAFEDVLELLFPEIEINIDFL